MNWSGDIDVNIIGSADFMVKDEDFKNRIIKVTTSQEKSIVFLIFEEVQVAEVPYLVKCLSAEMSATFYQSAKKDVSNFYEIDYHNNPAGVPFAWDRPHQDHQIKLTVKFAQKAFAPVTFKINIDKINQTMEQAITSTSRAVSTHHRKVIIKTVLENNTRVLKIFTDDYKELKDNDNEDITLQINMNIKFFGVSLITSSYNRRRELLFLSVGDIELLWIQNNRDNIYQMRAKTMHLDYNSYYNANYPVVLTPMDTKEIQEGKKYFFDFLVQRRITQKNV